MCGITGIYFSQSKLDEQARTAMGMKVRAMTSTLSLRGPDSSGVFVSNEIALGHTRLSILDTSDAGAQPMTLPDTGLTLVYNGECYNFQALRQELESLGSNFLSGSDTEVVLHAYSKWGLQGLKKLEGIFALALWDNTRKRLVLMRDRFGVKPLYYGDSTFGLAFGSEIKAVLAAGGVNLTMDEQALSEYLWFGNTHQERSFYSGVRQIEPGHWMIIDEGCDVLVESWWLAGK